MLLKRLRLPRSESARLRQPAASFSRNGMAASVPTDIRAMAVACRAGRLIRSATSKPRPSPIATRARARSGSTGRSLGDFGMDIVSGIRLSLYVAGAKNRGEMVSSVKKETAAFQIIIRDAVEAAEKKSALITIGIRPASAHPGFGYIEMGEPIPGKPGLFRVVRFREKPNVDLAESFIRKGNFRWNAGMFVWTVPTILTEFNRHAPEFGRFISMMSSPDAFEMSWGEKFSKLPRTSFDYAVMEHADRVLVLEAEFDWDDVGGWPAVARYFPG